jgi:hypothetical protein
MLIIRVEIRSQMNVRCVYNVSHHAIGSGKWIQQDLNCTWTLSVDVISAILHQALGFSQSLYNQIHYRISIPILGDVTLCKFYGTSEIKRFFLISCEVLECFF